MNQKKKKKIDFEATDRTSPAQKSVETGVTNEKRLPLGGWNSRRPFTLVKYARTRARREPSHHSTRAIEATTVKNDSIVARFYESLLKPVITRLGCSDVARSVCSTQQIPDDLPLNFMNLYSIRLTYLFHLNASPGRVTNRRITRNAIVPGFITGGQARRSVQWIIFKIFQILLECRSFRGSRFEFSRGWKETVDERDGGDAYFGIVKLAMNLNLSWKERKLEIWYCRFFTMDGNLYLIRYESKQKRDFDRASFPFEFSRGKKKRDGGWSSYVVYRGNL